MAKVAPEAAEGSSPPSSPPRRLRWVPHRYTGSSVYRITKEIGSLVSDKPCECMASTIDKAKIFFEGGIEIDPSIVESISGLIEALFELDQGKGERDLSK
ncbi:hypothetical protein Bca52824_010924 [Brassica carinata]|uniref:Uncharacterized protein n=1 Tax=Brassica carinata TaxID=52824 RepID=A0A8X7WET0_BRACI|nr:hypothetical protein Bca52824_010924 [Brassica carinata]